MALEFVFNTPVTSDSGTPLSIAYARLQTILYTDEENIEARLDLYESEEAYNDQRKTIWIDEIPRELRTIVTSITAGQYINLDMQSIHNGIRQVLLQGSDYGNYPDWADPNWKGLHSYDPANNIIPVMPS